MSESDTDQDAQESDAPNEGLVARIKRLVTRG